MFQEGALFDGMTVLENVLFPLTESRSAKDCLPDNLSPIEAASEILDSVGLAKAAHKLPSQISGGMRRRASLARALVVRPKLSLLDDPTAGLDPVASSVIMKLIDRFHSSYQMTSMIAGHDLRRLLPQVDYVLFFNQGELIFEGSVPQLLNSTDSFIRSFVSARYDTPALN